MSFKHSIFAVLLAAICGFGSADAQVESESMEDLSAWGTRLQAATEQEFANTLWSRSDNALLLELLQTAQSQAITPSERALVKRLLLSPARRPEGQNADALLVERIRLLLELGEADAAAAIAPRRETETMPYSGDAIATDLDMARGLEASACERLEDPTRDSTYWLKLRAVCAVLTKNYAGAELAIEFASARGMEDPWFVEAVFAASGGSPTPPAAQLDSGLSLALSIAAGLNFDDTALDPARPAIGVIAAEREELELETRLRLANEASLLGLMPVEVHRALLSAHLAAFLDTQPEDALSSWPVQIDWSAAPELEALFTLSQDTASPGQKAEALANRLGGSLDQTLAEQIAIAQLHATDLEALPAIAQTAAYGPIFARTALLLGDAELAKTWIASFDFGGVPAVSDAEKSKLSAMRMVIGGDRSVRKQLSVQAALLQAAAEGKDRRHLEKLLSAWNGLGLVLDANGRNILRGASPGGREISPQTLLVIKSAANSGAIGEAVLMVLDQTAGEPETLSAPSLAALLDILVMIKAGDIASGLALEASGSWTD